MCREAYILLEWTNVLCNMQPGQWVKYVKGKIKTREFYPQTSKLFRLQKSGEWIIQCGKHLSYCLICEQMQWHQFEVNWCTFYYKEWCNPTRFQISHNHVCNLLWNCGTFLLLKIAIIIVWMVKKNFQLYWSSWTM